MFIQHSTKLGCKDNSNVGITINTINNRRKTSSITFIDTFNIKPKRILLSLCEGMGKPITNKILASVFNTAYFKFIPFLAFLLIVNNIPDEGQQASSHTLCQKIEALLSCSALYFQPGTLLKDGLLQGKQ